MIVLNSYLLCSGERLQAHVRLSERQMDNVHAIFLEGTSTKPLDAECGAGPMSGDGTPFLPAQSPPPETP